MGATPRTIDFQNADDEGPASRAGSGGPPRTFDGKLLTAKQVRARARRRAKRAEMMTDEEFHAIYKPIEEWDLDELAHGRPRGPAGTFKGPAPKWITREVHERSMERFKAAIRTKMNGETPTAIDAIQWILGNDEVDDKGKPIVPASTKLDAAKFLIEHVVGKPTVRVESDVSVKLQAILGVVMANPSDANDTYNVGHLPGVTMPMVNDLVEGSLSQEQDDGDLDGTDF